MISEETINELKYLSDETGIINSDSDDTDDNDYYVDDTDSDFDFSTESISISESEDQDSNDFDWDFSVSSLFGRGDNGDIDGGLFNNRPMLRGWRPMRRYRVVGRIPIMDGQSLMDGQSYQQPDQPPMHQPPFHPLAPHVIYSMLMLFLILGICACIWTIICGFGLGWIIKKKEFRFKNQIKRDIDRKFVFHTNTIDLVSV